MSVPVATFDFWMDQLEGIIQRQGSRPTDDAREGFELNCGRFVDRISMCGALEPNQPHVCEFNFKVMDDGGIVVAWKAPQGGHIALVILPNGQPHFVDEVDI